MKKTSFTIITDNKNTYLQSPEGAIICWATTKFIKKHFSSLTNKIKEDTTSK